jgi:hypothetical protein
MSVKLVKPEPQPPVLTSEPAPRVPWIGNTIMPHPWDVAAPGGVCRRCGADWPTRDNCP